MIRRRSFPLKKLQVFIGAINLIQPVFFAADLRYEDVKSFFRNFFMVYSGHVYAWRMQTLKKTWEMKWEGQWVCQNVVRWVCQLMGVVGVEGPGCARRIFSFFSSRFRTYACSPHHIIVWILRPSLLAIFHHCFAVKNYMTSVQSLAQN